ncbi:MAG: enoyl-CoA hydratase/isomerase family protein, partial [Rhodobiaceae bacterium]|nr:enoyl-CoA hydratase/isomerase family protein [Rhodobiaceae bacterium]
GIVMGGGVGLSVHGSHRVGTEAVTFAMPETGIGLFPDVGATYVLPRMAGETGLYLGLTGARLKTPDAHHAGVLTHICPRDRHPALTEALCGAGDTDAILADFCEAATGATLPEHQAEIDRCFAGTSVEDILGRLASDGSAWANAQANTLAQKSPTSLKITFRQLRLGATLEFGDAMRTEFRIVSRVLQGHEFFEGVRAVIIDKDQAPRWQPDALDKVSASDIDAYFAPLDDELDV